MVGHVEEQDLRGAHQQRAFDLRRVGRQPAFERGCEQMAQRAEPPQHGGDQAAHQRAVALGQLAQRRLIFELFVERTLAPQHAVENLGGDAADGKAGNGRRHIELEDLAGAKVSVEPAYTEFER